MPSSIRNGKSDTDGDSVKTNSYALKISFSSTEASNSSELLFLAGLYVPLSLVLSTYKHPNSSYMALDYCNSDPPANLCNRGNLDNAGDVRGMLCLDGAAIIYFGECQRRNGDELIGRHTAIYFDRAWSLYHEQGCAISFLD